MKFNNPHLKKLGAVLNLLLILALLFVFFHYTSIDGIMNVLRTTSLPWFTLAFVISLLQNIFSSVRFWLLLRKQAISISLPKLIGINIGVRFYSFFSPISSVGSILRFQRLISVEKITEGLAAFGANRVFEILFLFSMGVFWGLTSINQDVLNPFAFIIYLLALMLLLWFAFKFSDFVTAWAEHKQESVSSKIWLWIYRVIGKLFRSFSIYRTFSLKEILTLLGIALLGDLFSLLGFTLVALSLHIPISFVDLGWIRALMLLVAFTPITLPGGFGMREVSAVVLMTSLGISAELSGAFSLLLYARSVFTALFGGVVELVLNIRTFVERHKTPIS
ncbi:MAG: flippase-like domain-containing protein [Chloroflexi bacterium]|nr:flippase-like domain-containing protein [Chloroflexota bacterium]